jgi:hypothetical protein
VRLEELGKLKKLNDFIGTRIRDLPACSIMPQPTTLPRAPKVHKYREFIGFEMRTNEVAELRLKNQCVWFI